MKQIYTLIALLTLSLTSLAGRPVNTVTTWWDDWSKASSWSLGRIPKNGDSVVIPAGKGIVFNVATSFTNLYINVIGILSVQSTMTLDAASSVKLPGGGRLYAFGANRATEIIVLGGKNKFDQNSPLNVYGVGLANSSSGISPSGFSPSATLPVTYSSFYATKNNNGVVLTWSTAVEINNNNFKIQRNFDGRNWETIGEVTGAGTSSATSNYSYTDKNMTATVAYYRLCQVDKNGIFQYSIVKTIRNSETAPVAKIYTAGKSVNIEFNSEIKNAITVRLLNTNGQVIAQQNYEHASYKVTLNANTANTGIYLVQVTDGISVSETTKVIL